MASSKITNSMIQSLTLKEAVKLRETLDNHIEILQEAKREENINKVNSLLEEVGLSIDDLKTTKKKTRKSSGTVKIKYMHPDNKDLVSTGRGRQKNWISKWLEENPDGVIEDLLVPEQMPE
jgi:DNA-binding protein H-NS